MKKYSNFGGAFLTAAILFSGVFAQVKPTVAVKPKTSDEAGAMKSKNPVKVENIEQDVAEALTLIEDNHIGGKTLDYNELLSLRLTRCCTRSTRIPIISIQKNLKRSAPNSVRSISASARCSAI